MLEQANPFAVLTAIVAPAILTNASSVLSLGTGNRLGRVVDRTRIVAREPQTTATAEQLRMLRTRAQMLVRALRCFYVALGLFASSAFVSLLGAIASGFGIGLLFRAAAVLGLGTGALAVISLVLGCALVARETRYALQMLEDEARP